MAQTKKEQRSLPPYLPYKTFINFIDSLKLGGVPSRIDKGLMKTMSGGQQSSLVKGLQYLNLINAEKRPADLLNRLVHSEGAERQEALRDTLRGAYRFLFEDDFDLERATEGELRETFESKGGVGGDTVRKAMAFFLAAAKASELPLSPYLASAKASKGGVRQRRSKSGTKGGGGRANGGSDVTPSILPWAQMLLAKFPSFDPAWPDDVKAKWFDGFQQLMAMQEENGGEA